MLKRLLQLLVCAAVPAIASAAQPHGASTSTVSAEVPELSTILYGTCYYHEYMPYERLEKDVALIKEAGFNVVRMGESTWSLFEPEPGRFEFAWMDRVVDAMGKAGIKVIMGTPTYSVPTWMAHQHPEILARRNGVMATYGMRQNMNTDAPAYRFYAERLIRKMAAHYKDNPTVIGWQVDNETSPYGAANDDVFIGFRRYLQNKFGTPEALNKAWVLNYWGQTIPTWEDFPKREGAQSTGYKLEWTRWSQMRVTEFLRWQTDLLRECASPRQFVTHDFAGAMHGDVNEHAISSYLDFPSVNIYHWGFQDDYAGSDQTLQADFTRGLKGGKNFMVPETTAQTTDWSSSAQYPPYDGQIRQDLYTHLSNGANMVAYWHWSSIHANQETYWKGVLSHDLQPGRAYAEMKRAAHELKAIGPRLVNLKIKSDVAILWSRDSMNAINDMPFAREGAFGGSVKADYSSLVRQLHRSLYDLKVGTDFVFQETEDFSSYKLLIVPMLYVADDTLLQRIADYIRNGGHVVMTFKSGFTNEHTMVRPVMAPGPLREALGFHYQEFSNLGKPLPLKGDPYKAGAENQVQYWAEFLELDTAKALAHYDHHFFGRWPAITTNRYGNGTVLYQGTYLSDRLQTEVLRSVLGELGMIGPDQQLPASVHVRTGVNGAGRVVRYYFNYSGSEVSFAYPHRGGTALLRSGSRVATNDKLTLAPWDVAIIEEDAK